MKAVLVTGMSGLIGGALRARLEGRYRLRALNRSAIAGVDCHRADISDLEGILPAFRDIDTVVHLAAVVKREPSWDEVLRINLIGSYNVFEAARRAGVKRVVFASSIRAVASLEDEMPYKALVEGRYESVREGWPTIAPLAPVRPWGLYGCSKVWGEALARHYSDAYGLSALCVRIGRVTGQDRPVDPRDFAVWTSQRDAARVLELCIAAPESLKFDIFFAESNNRWGFKDLEHAREVLGFVPQDSAESYR